MTTTVLNPLKTLSKQQVNRLEKLGATVSSTTVTATPAQMWAARILGKTRVLLAQRGNRALP